MLLLENYFFCFTYKLTYSCICVQKQLLSVLSAESEAAERQLLNRLNEILERPLPERPRRFFVSRRSAFQQARSSSNNVSSQQQPTQPPQSQQSARQQQQQSQPEIGGVRYGIELLSRHIDNMQRLCRWEFINILVNFSITFRNYVVALHWVAIDLFLNTFFFFGKSWCFIL